MTRNRLFVIVVLYLLVAGLVSLKAETYSDYQEETERLFLGEASKQRHFKKAIQTARLLGYLEYMSIDGFSSFHKCMKEEKRWEYLSAAKREKLLNRCHASGRSLSSSPLVVETRTVRPAEAERQTQSMSDLRGEISDLKNQMLSMKTEIKNAIQALHEKISSQQQEQTVPQY